MDKVCIICGSNDFQIKSEKFCSQKCIHTHGRNKIKETKIKCKFCDNYFIIGGPYDNHLKTHKTYHYHCENCGDEVFEKYGSGRFCSSKCARGFSTKTKRIEINEKVKNTFIIKGITKNIMDKYIIKTNKEFIILKKCPICDNEFYSTNKTCSRKCSHLLSSINSKGKKHKMIKDTSKMGGLRNGGGKSKQIPYTNWLNYKMSLNNEEIKVAKELDELKLNWNRNIKGFPYTTLDGKCKKYYPDFIIDEHIYIEYKGWITEEMEHKMLDAKIKNNLNLIIVVGNDKRYINNGIKISEIKKLNLFRYYV